MRRLALLTASVLACTATDGDPTTAPGGTAGDSTGSSQAASGSTGNTDDAGSTGATEGTGSTGDTASTGDPSATTGDPTTGATTAPDTDDTDDTATTGEPPPAPGPNDDDKTLVVWSQNIRMGLEGWPNIVRCMGDPACNGLGAFPDVVLVQEASCKNAGDLAARMGAPLAEGGLGDHAWQTHCAENPGSGGETGHWLSNAVVYRGDRLELAESVDLTFHTGDGTHCDNTNNVLPIVKLRDLLRVEGGYAEKHATFAVRHDDHFGGGVKNKCDAPDAPTVFCVWKNAKLIDAAVADIGGGLLVMAGDWNYAPKKCTYEGVETTDWKRDYACTTKGIKDPCDGGQTPNLGWRDPLLEHTPDLYDQVSWIDHVHLRDIKDFTLNLTRVNDQPGVVRKCFYCDGEVFSDPAVDPGRMSDHLARLLRVAY